MNEPQVPIWSILGGIAKWVFITVFGPIAALIGVVYAKRASIRSAFQESLDEHETKMSERFDGLSEQMTKLDTEVKVMQTAHGLTTLAIYDRLAIQDRQIDRLRH